MKLKTFSGVMLTLVLLGMLTLVFNVQPVKAESSEPPATEWTKTYSRVQNEEAFSVVQTSDGGYALAGSSSYLNDPDFWLVKVDSSGNHEWDNSYGEVGEWDVARSVVETSDGRYALAGCTTSFGAGGADFWLVKVAGAERPPTRYPWSMFRHNLRHTGYTRSPAPNTNQTLWNYTTGGFVASSPAVADGMVFVGSGPNVYAFGNVIRVPEDYPTIQQAINAATPGATISIAPRVSSPQQPYNETLIINKTLTLLGRRGSIPIFEGGGSGVAVTLLSGASGSTVAGIVITNYDQGILIQGASECKIYDNIMSQMDDSGMALEGSSAANNQIYSNIFQDNTIAINLNAPSTSNNIYDNTISSNNIALSLAESSGNTIYANTISENEVGIDVSYSSGDTIYHNNFIDNTQQVSISGSSGNVWDNGYPSGGNYWSDYPGIDADGDGIGDMPYVIDENNRDRFPLMEPWPCEITPLESAPVGGIYILVDKFTLLTPYITLVSTILAATAATVIYVKHIKRRKEKR